MDLEGRSDTDVPHLNHRRGDTRRRVQQPDAHYQSAWGGWNRSANRSLRAATRRTLHDLRARGFDSDEVMNTVWVVSREADNYWNYD